MRILRQLLALLLVAVLGSSAVSAPQRWVRTTVSITVDGVARSYLVVRPAASGSEALPVMMELHGAAASASLELSRSGFLTATGPAILVYPAGVDGHWNAGACCGTTTADDVKFIAAVVSQVLAREPGADPSRVYLAGYSNGGRMAYRVACEEPQLFTAVAVFAAVDAKACTEPGAVSLLVAAGTADSELTLTSAGTPHTVNGYREPSVTAQVEQYRVANDCGTTASKSTTGRLTATTWTDCGSGHSVELALYSGVDHSWPLTSGSTPGMAVIAWAFFTSQGGTQD